MNSLASLARARHGACGLGPRCGFRGHQCGVERLQPLAAATDEATGAAGNTRDGEPSGGGLDLGGVDSRIVDLYFGVENLNGEAIVIDLDRGAPHRVRANVDPDPVLWIHA